MSASVHAWDAERIEDLRRRAERLRDAEARVCQEAAAMAHAGAWSAPLDDAISAETDARGAVSALLSGAVVLSLLDELERERKWKALHAASPEGVRDVVSARALAADSLLPIVATWKAKVAELTDELESVRRERDALKEGLRNGRLLVNGMHPENQ